MSEVKFDFTTIVTSGRVISCPVTSKIYYVQTGSTFTNSRTVSDQILSFINIINLLTAKGPFAILTNVSSVNEGNKHASN